MPERLKNVDKIGQRVVTAGTYRVSTVVKFLPGKNIGHIPAVSLKPRSIKGLYGRGNKKKKADPQEKWMNSVSKAAATAKGSSAVIDMLRYLSNQENVLRKEKSL